MGFDSVFLFYEQERFIYQSHCKCTLKARERFQLKLFHRSNCGHLEYIWTNKEFAVVLNGYVLLQKFRDSFAMYFITKFADHILMQYLKNYKIYYLACKLNHKMLYILSFDESVCTSIICQLPNISKPEEMQNNRRISQKFFELLNYNIKSDIKIYDATTNELLK